MDEDSRVLPPLELMIGAAPALVVVANVVCCTGGAVVTLEAVVGGVDVDVGVEVVEVVVGVVEVVLLVEVVEVVGEVETVGVVDWSGAAKGKSARNVNQ